VNEQLAAQHISDTVRSIAQAIEDGDYEDAYQLLLDSANDVAVLARDTAARDAL
jgi:hypothetical protein